MTQETAAQAIALDSQDTDAGVTDTPVLRDLHDPRPMHRSRRRNETGWPNQEPGSRILSRKAYKKKLRPSAGVQHPSITRDVLQKVAHDAMRDIRDRCVREEAAVCWNVVECFSRAYYRYTDIHPVTGYLLKALNDFVRLHDRGARHAPEDQESITMEMLYRVAEQAFQHMQTQLLDAVRRTTESDDVPGARTEDRRLTRFIHLPGLPHERFVVRYRPGATLSLRTMDRECHFRKKLRKQSRGRMRYHRSRMNHR